MSLQIKKLDLTNFRSYRSAAFEFTRHSVVVGANATGKTNLLEALFLIASSKSFRADRESEMIHWGEAAARVAVLAEHDQEETEVVAQLASSPKGRVQKTFLADRRKLSSREAASRLPMVLFAADDVRLVDGAPGRRRRALDLAIGQSRASYRRAAGRYSKVVASRNRLLEKIAAGESSTDELDFWDQELVESGQILVDQRTEFINYLNRRLASDYKAIAAPSHPGLPTDLKVIYQPLIKKLATELPARRTLDIAVGTTTAGPHRDDWKLLLGNRVLSSFGSGGEYRTALLAFRLGESAWLEDQSQTTPVILLDDVFSELDEHRRRALLANLPDGQTIITTPETSVLPPSFAKTASIISIKRQTPANV